MRTSQCIICVNFVSRRRNIVIRSFLMWTNWFSFVIFAFGCRTFAFMLNSKFMFTFGKSPIHIEMVMVFFPILLLRFFAGLRFFSSPPNDHHKYSNEHWTRERKKINHAFFGNPIEKHFLRSENNVLTASPLYFAGQVSIFNIHSKKADFYTKQ